MGQRLNIEIVSGGETLANAYYHWSAYTDSAIRLTEKIIEAYEDNAARENKLLVAVNLLQATGAGLNDLEQLTVRADDTGKYSGIIFKHSIDRNEGLLSVTEAGIKNTESWEEGRVTIDLDTQKVHFGVFWYEDFSDEVEEDEIDFESLDDADYFDFDDISFENFYKFRDLYEQHPYGVKFPNGHVVTWIM